MVYPPSLCSVDSFFSAETVSLPLATSIWISSFETPGKSKEAVTRFFSVFSWRSNLKFEVITMFNAKDNPCDLPWFDGPDNSVVVMMGSSLNVLWSKSFPKETLEVVERLVEKRVGHFCEEY